jgi:hypothetical protein
MRTLLLVLAFASTAGAQPAPRDVDIKSTDGTLLKATYFPAPPRRALARAAGRAD